MILKYFRFYLILVTLLASIHALGQDKIRLDYFEANENRNTVLLKWAISQGSTCNGITITRSSDSIYFSPIGRIEGVCGSADAPQPYSFVDENPLKNQKNYYKLELGISGFSRVISLNVRDKNGKDYQVIPNPIQDIGRIYFDNPNFESYQLKIYNINGSLINRINTLQNYFDIKAHSYSDGLYLFNITNPETTIKGKFIISR